MDYHPGGSLETLITSAIYAKPKAKFSHHDVCFYASEMLTALWALHESGFTHNDKAIRNYLIGADGHLLVGGTCGGFKRPTYPPSCGELAPTHDPNYPS